MLTLTILVLLAFIAYQNPEATKSVFAKVKAVFAWVRSLFKKDAPAPAPTDQAPKA